MKRKHIALLAATLLAALGLQAQDGFNMPFSQFGIGHGEQPYSMPMAARMGGAVYTQAGNNYVNPFNPASYAAVERESFVFDMGVNLQFTTLRHNEQSMRDADGNIGHLLMAMPITKWWKVAGGLMSYSAVDYESVALTTGPGFGTVKNIYDGTGGVNQVFLGTAFNIPAGRSRSLQVGFNANYLTGNILRAISYNFQGNDSTYYINGRRYKKTSVSNIIFDLGLQLRQQVGERYTLGLGLVYKPYRDMKVRDLALIYTYAADESLVDTVFPARGEDPEFQSRLEQASTVGIGLSLERNRRWRVAADATFSPWNGMRYTEDTAHAIFGTSAQRYSSFSRYCIGVERMVNMDAATYWGRMGWSLGAHIEQGTLCLEVDGKEHSLGQWGIGAGLTLPMRKGRSLLAISAAYTSMGDKAVLQHNCFTLGISISSCERWFVKRKYN